MSDRSLLVSLCLDDPLDPAFPIAALKELQEKRHLDVKSSTKQHPPTKTFSTPEPEVPNAPTSVSPSQKKTRSRSLYHDFMSHFWKREKFSAGSVVEKRRRMSMEWQRTREGLFNNEVRSPLSLPGRDSGKLTR